MHPEHKEFIDRATHEQLLQYWLSAPYDNPLVEGTTGDYYLKVMIDKDSSTNTVSVAEKHLAGYSATRGPKEND